MTEPSITWSQIQWTYTRDDVDAYCDARRINGHFGLPLPHRERVFAIWMDQQGLMIRDPKAPPRLSPKGNPVIGGDFGNLVAYREVKTPHPGAWIWAERYTFTLKAASPSWQGAQDAFVSLLGKDRLLEIQKRALSLGLNPGGKTGGRPDLAVYVPDGAIPWRFIELKKKGKDYLRKNQKKWLTLISEVFGKQAAVEATLILAGGKLFT